MVGEERAWYLALPQVDLSQHAGTDGEAPAVLLLELAFRFEDREVRRADAAAAGGDGRGRGVGDVDRGHMGRPAVRYLLQEALIVGQRVTGGGRRGVIMCVGKQRRQAV